MEVLPPAINRLIAALSQLPGIGIRTAQRLTFYLLRRKDAELLELGNAVSRLKHDLSFCRECQNICQGEICPLCAKEGRDRTLLCIVADPLDVVALEKVGVYKGLYHVLHGIINPLDGIGPDDLRIKELVARVSQGQFREIILATNPTLEGEATAVYLQRKLQPFNLKITRIARGLPVGGDLEYADEVTLLRALEGRMVY